MAEVLVPVELRPALLSIAVRTAAPEAAGRSVQGRVKRGRAALDAAPEEPRGILCQRRPHARGIHARQAGRTAPNLPCHQSEERRVGKEWVRTCRSRWGPES